MAYTIKYIQASRPTGDEVWTGSLLEAQELGKRAVASGAADRVEIFQGANLVFHHPRVT